MLRAIALIGLLGIIQGEPETQKQLINVSVIQCGRISDRLTPRLVALDPTAYIDSCVQWRGVIESVSEADLEGTKVWVVPLQGKFDYCGSTKMKIRLVSANESERPQIDSAPSSFEYLSSGEGADSRIGQPVILIGKILGITESPIHQVKTKNGSKVLIGVFSIQRSDPAR